MDDIINLHSLARKYFIDKLNDIRSQCLLIDKKFEEIFIKNNRDLYCANKEFENDVSAKVLINELNIRYPDWEIRKHILESILISIESIVVENLNSLILCKEAILKACKESKIDDKLQTSVIHAEKEAICKSEKEQFFAFFNNLNDKELNYITSLFSRRVLSKIEITDIKYEIYNFKNCCKAILCFKDEDIATSLGKEGIRNAIEWDDPKRLFEINTGEIGKVSYSMDFQGFNPLNTSGFDIYWCTERLTWLIEKNHEGYYLFYGQELVEEVKRRWNNWNNYAITQM